MDAMRHVNIRVFGDVHGIGFRATARRVAARLGVAGFVRNDPEGSVYIEAEGEWAALEEFIAWCRRGPPLSHIERVEVEARNHRVISPERAPARSREGEPRDYSDFKVLP